MNKKVLFFLLCSFFINLAYSKSPEINGIPYTPDDWLLSQGQKWFYRTNTSLKPKQLNFRDPTENEKFLVERAQIILNTTSAKSIALVDGDDVVWVGFKSPATAQSHFLSQSIAKTITSMAVGKAICQGKFSFNSVAANLIPELQGTDLGKSTVRDLLMMASGTWEGNKDTSNISEEQFAQLYAGKMSYLDLLKTSKVNSFQSTLFGTRKAKSDAKASMKADVLTATFNAPADLIARLQLLSPDLKAAGRIRQLSFAAGEELTVTDVVLAESE
jgi:hypothetical protein